MRKFTLAFVASAFILGATVSSPVYAHKVVVSAYAEDTFIEGEIGFSGGEMAADIVVEVFDENGEKLGETKTDEEGIFQFTPTKAVAHIFKANLGAGHIAEYRLEAEDLPESVGVASNESAADAKETSASVPSETAAPSETGTETVAPTIDQAQLQQLVSSSVSAELAKLKPVIAKAVRNETKPLRKEIAAYKEKNDMQSILGGIGYIFGLFGIGFYLVARRERSKTAAN